MKKTRILILGGGIMQIPSIECAKNSGWYVILADANDQAPGIPRADAFEHVDLKDKEGMLAAAEKWHARGGLDGVFTAGTDFSATVAWVSEKLGLPGIAYETALTASDKQRMRDCFRDHKVPSPAYTVYTEGDIRSPAEAGLAFPLVVKPVDNMGARGIRRVNNQQDFKDALDAARIHSKSNRVIVEEFIPGPEFSIDAIVYKGAVTICGVADRHIYFPPYFVEMGHTMPSSYPEDTLNEIIRVFKLGVSAIGITNGAAKGDIKLSPRGPMIGEIAARLSGGYMSGWTFPYHSGVDVTQAALNVALGEPPGDLTPSSGNVSAERAIISIPGTIRKAEGIDEVKRIPGVRDLFTVCRDGDTVQFPKNNVQKWGNVISCLESRNASVRAAEQGCSAISVILEPGIDETCAFLLGKLDSWAPDAYRLQVKENSEALEAMAAAEGDLSKAVSALVPLPRQKLENGEDWNHISFQSGLEKVLSITGITFLTASSENAGAGVLGRMFWRAFLRGGYQGGVWLVETVRELAGKKRDLKAFINQWDRRLD